VKGKKGGELSSFLTPPSSHCTRVFEKRGKIRRRRLKDAWERKGLVVFADQRRRGCVPKRKGGKKRP